MAALFTFVRSLRPLALPTAAALLLAACAAAPPTAPGPSAAAPAAASKPPAQALPRLTPTEPPAGLGTVERFAWTQVVHLGDAFTAGDVPAFLSRVSRGFYRGYSALEVSLTSLMAASSARTAVVAVRKVSEEEGRVSVRADWTRSVTLRDGSVEERRGQTDFLFLKSDTSLRLLDYRGDPPFAIDGI